MGAKAAFCPRGWIYSHDAVFNGASPNPSAWTDLDLSAVIGPRSGLVLFEISAVGGGGNAGYIFRETGEGDATPLNFPLEAGGCHSVSIADEKFGYVMMHAYQGHVDWYCTLVDTQTLIRVFGFLPGY